MIPNPNEMNLYALYQPPWSPRYRYQSSYQLNLPAIQQNSPWWRMPGQSFWLFKPGTFKPHNIVFIFAMTTSQNPISNCRIDHLSFLIIPIIAYTQLLPVCNFKVNYIFFFTPAVVEYGVSSRETRGCSHKQIQWDADSVSGCTLTDCHLLCGAFYKMSWCVAITDRATVRHKVWILRWIFGEWRRLLACFIFSYVPPITYNI